MNIVRIARAFFPVVDGAAQHVWGLSRAQAASGHRVSLYQPHVATWPGLPEGVSITRVNLGPVRRFVYGSKPTVALFGTMAGRALSREATRKAVDLVHVHGDAVDAAAVGVWARAAGLPLVLTVHGGLNTGARYRRWAPRLFRWVDRFIVVNEAVGSQLVQLGIATEKIQVISSGIDFARFAAPAARTPAPAGAQAPLRVISVGRLHKVKGYTYLIQAARMLAEQSVPVEMTIVGSGPEEAALRSEAAGLENLRLIGGRDTGQVAELLHEADVFVLPSIDMGIQAEGSPTAVFEAMAAGLPIVCTNTGGLPRVVQHGVHGLVVAERSPRELAAALAEMNAAPERRAAIGALNIEVAKTKDWNVIAASIEGVYRDALGDRRYEAIRSRA